MYVVDLTDLAKTDAHDPAAFVPAWDQLHAWSALQGLVNRDDPRLYLRFIGDDASLDDYWLKYITSDGEWLEDEKIEDLPADVVAAVQGFRGQVNGVVVWDERIPATSNIASTIAGLDSLIPVRFDQQPGSLYHRLVHDPAGPQLDVKWELKNQDGSVMFPGKGPIPGTDRDSTGSAKNDAYLWAIERFIRSGRCNPRKIGYYPDAWWLTRHEAPKRVPFQRTLLTNHDYFIAHQGFIFDLGPWDDLAPDDDPDQKPGEDARTMTEMLRAAYEQAEGEIIHVAGFVPWDQKYTEFTGQPRHGVASEWRQIEIMSCFNAFVDADAAGYHHMANASVFQHYPLQDRYPQTNKPTERDLRERGFLTEQGVKPKKYVAFYVGDYDAAAWLYQRLPFLWDDPVRGEIPLGWAFNPVLAYRFPVGMAYTRKTASENDVFVTGDSGAGYINPGYLVPERSYSGLPSGLEEWSEHSKREYGQWDLSLTGFVIDGYGPPMNDEVKRAYAEFSPDGVVAQKVPPFSQMEGVPFVRMGADLTPEIDSSAEVIANEAPQEGPWFKMYRTVLWSPTQHRDLMNAVKERRPDIEFVDSHTLFRLLKAYIQQEGEAGIDRLNQTFTR